MEFNFDNIQDFKNNFYNICNYKIVNFLTAMESERKTIRKEYISEVLYTFAISIALLIFGYFIKNIGVLMAGFITLILSFCLYPYLKQSYETNIKYKLMPLMMKAFGSFSWSATSLIQQYEIKNSKLFLMPELLKFDDNFIGLYKKTDIFISEIVNEIGHNYKHVIKSPFTKHKGVFISLNSGKKFSGHTILRKKIGLQAPKFYEEVKLEDPQFQQMYFVESTDQVEARIILTPAFMERLKKITNSFNSDDVQCSFRDGNLMIYLPSPMDLFKFVDLDKPLTLAEPQQFFEEIISILEMIDHLKILEKTGL